MKLSRSSFYRREKPVDPDQKKTEADLVDRIEAICLEFPGYGYRRVTYQLKYERWQVNHKKVLRIMRESDLLCRMKRRWVKTTDSSHHFARYANLISRITINRLNQVWLSDITYIRIRTGFVYLAAILDAFSRRVIGYSLSHNLDNGLAVEALRMAIRQRKAAAGVVHHSDQGIQYASNEYVAELEQNGFLISMSRVKVIHMITRWQKAFSRP
jgi:transposase InsO family protein